MRKGAVDVHLIRPGETRSYAADVGLTARGEGQCRRRGMHVAEELGDGEHVRLLWAPSVRSARTADEVRSGLEDGLAATGRRATVGDPEPAPWFRNFDVWAPTGPREPTQAWREYEATLRNGGDQEPPALAPIWLLEMDRFWQSSPDEAIGLWMTVPLLTFEPPASVLERVWTGLLELARSDHPGDHAVCCTHSGPMRAFSKAVFGDDLGDPGNCEELRVRLDPPYVEASVTFRSQTRRVPVPHLGGTPPPGWPHS